MVGAELRESFDPSAPCKHGIQKGIYHAGAGSRPKYFKLSTIVQPLGLGYKKAMIAQQAVLANTHV
jgi:hypothetical protein